jgi:hypothetical protein
MYEAGYSFMQSFDIFTTWLMVGNVKYFSRVVYPSILFPRKFKNPLTLNPIELLGLNFLIKRLKKIHTKRIKQGRISQTSASTLRYSGVRIPTGFAFYFVPFKLVKNALVGYVRLEWIEFKQLFSKSN